MKKLTNYFLERNAVFEASTLYGSVVVYLVEITPATLVVHSPHK